MRRHRLLLASFAIVAAVACGACQADQSGDVSVSGTVLDQPFDGMGGAAEEVDGSYVVTLSDDPNFTCTSSPSGDYYTVEMFNVDGSGSFDAAGNVTFSHVADVIEQQGATRGSFSITVTTNAYDEPVVRGSIDASGDSSSVGGSFDVPVCP